MSTSPLNEAMKNVAAINELLEKLADNEKIGLSIDSSDLLFDILMNALAKAERGRNAAMIEERKNRNTETQAKIAAENGA